MTLSLIAAVALSLLQIGDGYTTYLALTTRDNVEEANKVAKWIFDKVGLIPSIITLKLLMCSLFLYVGVFYPYLWPILAFGTVGYIWVVYNNLKVLKNTRKD